MGEVYKMNIAGCERELPICPLNEHMDIAGFVMFSDVEITERAAQALLEKCPEHDVIVTAESKGIPVKSITTDHVQKLYLSKADCENLKDKRILIVDDVISTGESLAAMEELLHAIGGQVVGKACVLAEGDAKDRTDIIYLEPLPLFFK